MGTIAQFVHFLSEEKQYKKKNQRILWLVPTAYGLGTSNKSASHMKALCDKTRENKTELKLDYGLVRHLDQYVACHSKCYAGIKTDPQTWPSLVSQAPIEASE